MMLLPETSETSLPGHPGQGTQKVVADSYRTQTSQDERCGWGSSRSLPGVPNETLTAACFYPIMFPLCFTLSP